MFHQHLEWQWASPPPTHDAPESRITLPKETPCVPGGRGGRRHSPTVLYVEPASPPVHCKDCGYLSGLDLDPDFVSIQSLERNPD